MNAEEFILHQTDWIPLATVPARLAASTITQKSQLFWESLHEKNTGVYQVSLSRPKELVHKDIGYIGQSGELGVRVYNLKNSLTSLKNSHHQCGVYLRCEGVDVSQVYVRMLFSDNPSVLEDILHNAQRSKFKHDIGYAWEEASGGHRSCRITAMNSIDRCDMEKCMQLKEHLNKRIKQLQKDFTQNLI